MAVKVKICGITRPIDALLSTELGAELLGFNFYRPSPRFIEPAAAADIAAALPKNMITVGVFVNADLPAIERVLRQCPLDMVQLHGDETNERCLSVAERGVAVMKALRIRQPQDIIRADLFSVSTILLDAFDENLYGGTGRKFDWNWLRRIHGKTVFLAGGITPENAADALSAGPDGIDVCSGVEHTPGVKDPDKLKKLFVAVARFQAAAGR